VLDAMSSHPMPGERPDNGVMRLDARLTGQWTPAELGVHPVAGILARRAAGAGMFGVFLACHSTGTGTGEAVGYRYGCEPDLRPAPPWRWALPGRPAAGSGLAR
jgi:hypothetical protein